VKKLFILGIGMFPGQWSEYYADRGPLILSPRLRRCRRIYTLNKGSAASSNILRDQMTPFIKWLETAEEESD